MAEIIDMQGQWKGIYTFGPEYGNLVGQSFEFRLFLTHDMGNFSGKAFDMDAPMNYRDIPLINGFVKNDFISFIKKYETSYSVEDDGSYVVNKDLPGHEIHYYGNYNPAERKFCGKWEIKVGEEQAIDGVIEFLYTGTWEMYKESD